MTRKRYKNPQRTIARKKSKEVDTSSDFWTILTFKFEDELFFTDWDNTPNEEDVFKKYNEKWIEYCNKHNKKLTVSKVDPKAFYDYAISLTSERFLYESGEQEGS